MITTSNPLDLEKSIPFLITSSGLGQLSIENVSIFSALANTFNCLIAAGLCKSAAINNYFLLLFLFKK